LLIFHSENHLWNQRKSLKDISVPIDAFELPREIVHFLFGVKPLNSKERSFNSW